MALDPATAMIRKKRKSSTAYETATRKNDACPKHSEKLNAFCRSVIHLGIGILRGLRRIRLIVSWRPVDDNANNLFGYGVVDFLLIERFDDVDFTLFDIVEIFVRVRALCNCNRGSFVVLQLLLPDATVD
jgi:hypothetical protein